MRIAAILAIDTFGSGETRRSVNLRYVSRAIKKVIRVTRSRAYLLRNLVPYTSDDQQHTFESLVQNKMYRKEIFRREAEKYIMKLFS